MELFKVNVARYENSIFSGDAQSVTLTGIDGEFILTHDHAPQISLLRKDGKVSIKNNNGEITNLNLNEGGFCVFQKGVLNIFC